MDSPWDPATRANPFPFWDRAREEAAVWPGVGPETGRTFWFVTRHETCLEVFRDERIGHQPDLHVPADELYWDSLPDDDPLAVLGRNMLFVDPPDHTRLRRLASGSFRKSVIQRLAPRVEEVAAGLLDATGPGEPFDLMASFAEPLPVTIIAELLGVPRSDQDKFRAWTKSILAPSFEQAQVGAMEFVGYLNDLAEARRADPRDDMVTELVHVEDGGERLDHTEYLAMVFLLLVAGHETTVNLVGNGTLALSHHPDERSRWAGDPGLGPTAVEELVRFCGPVETATVRYAYEDLEVAGTSIPRGNPVIPALYAANRDPRRFEDPGALDLGRSPNPHIGFGFGIHHCLGAPLARLEAEVAFRLLLDRYPTIEVVDEDIPWPEGFFLRGPERLMVVG
jgi:cytochrome P450 PksS